MDIRDKHQQFKNLASRKKEPTLLDEQELGEEQALYERLGNNLGGPRAEAIRKEVQRRRELGPDRVVQPTLTTQTAFKKIVAVPIEISGNRETLAGMLNAVVDAARATDTPVVRRRRSIRPPASVPTSQPETIEQTLERLGAMGFPNLKTEQLQKECAAKIRLALNRTGSSPGTTYAVFTYGEGENATWDEEPVDFVPDDAKVIAQISNGEITYVSGRKK